MKRIFFLFLAISFLVLGCVRTYIKSSVNPDFKDIEYENVLVMAPLADIESQQIVEDKIVERLSEKGVVCTPSYKIFFQGKTYSREQLKNKIKKNGFDSVLYVRFTSVYNSESYVPKTTTTNGQIKNTYNGYSYSAETYETGGYYLSKPNFNIRTKLIDAVKNDVVWVSDTHSQGCAFCSFERIMDSFADNLAGQISDDEVLKENTNSGN